MRKTKSVYEKLLPRLPKGLRWVDMGPVVKNGLPLRGEVAYFRARDAWWRSGRPLSRSSECCGAIFLEDGRVRFHWWERSPGDEDQDRYSDLRDPECSKKLKSFLREALTAYERNPT